MQACCDPMERRMAKATAASLVPALGWNEARNVNRVQRQHEQARFKLAAVTQWGDQHEAGYPTTAAAPPPCTETTPWAREGSASQATQAHLNTSIIINLDRADRDEHSNTTTRTTSLANIYDYVFSSSNSSQSSHYITMNTSYADPHKMKPPSPSRREIQCGPGLLRLRTVRERCP